MFCRFNNYCIATAKSWSNFPSKHQQGEVPLKGKNSRLINEKIFLYDFVFKLCLLRFLRLVLNINLVRHRVGMFGYFNYFIKKRREDWP